MTECTGQRYWLKRITAARQRYVNWGRLREPTGAPGDQWLAWREWYAARLAYFDDALNKHRVGRNNRLRRKNNERKRDHGASRRGC